MNSRKLSFEDWLATRFGSKWLQRNSDQHERNVERGKHPPYFDRFDMKMAWMAALAQQEPPCNNPLRSEITCADLVRDNDNLRAALAQQAQPEMPTRYAVARAIHLSIQAEDPDAYVGPCLDTADAVLALLTPQATRII